MARNLFLAAAAAFAIGLSGLGGGDARAEELSAEERKAIEGVVRDYLLENPEILVEVMDELERRQNLAEEERDRETVARVRDTLDNDGVSYVAGAVDGDVTLVEFFDYRCGYCKRSHPDVTALMEADPKLRVVLKEFPILGPDSVIASRAAIAAKQQGKYYEFHDAMLSARGALDEDRVFDIAAEIGLDVARLREDMGSDDVTAEIEANYALAQALNINGTPTFVIGDQVVRGAAGRAAMADAIASAREACASC